MIVEPGADVPLLGEDPRQRERRLVQQVVQVADLGVDLPHEGDRVPLPVAVVHVVDQAVLALDLFQQPRPRLQYHGRGRAIVDVGHVACIFVPPAARAEVILHVAIIDALG